MSGEWLDPPRMSHTEFDCVQGRPPITRADIGRHWRCNTCKRLFEVFDTGDQRDPIWWREVPCHSAQSVDGLPMCKPIEYWNDHSYRATDEDRLVTCKECKDILKLMEVEL